jgi:hypothetical protein
MEVVMYGNTILSFIKVLLIVQLLVTSECGSRGITISIGDKVPPTFTFNSNFAETDYIPMFYVSEVGDEELDAVYTKEKHENKIIWQIVPMTGTDGEIKRLPTITYGSVPPRFTQNIPEHGPPPTLLEGKTYEAGGPPNLMPHGFARFMIRNNKVIAVPIRRPER